ncbi:gamma-glutamyl-gamma-aminobutyrate hydrolase family protein [Tessaracoccus sp. Z1128]
MKLLVIAPASRYEPGHFGELLTALADRTVDLAADEGWQATLIGLQDCGDHVWHTALAAADAVVLLGGHDVDPRVYHGRSEYPGSGDHLGTADRRSIAVVQACVADRRPLLGICRGLQLINVAYGGDIAQHLPTHLTHRLPDGERGMRDHLVDVAPGSQLADALPGEQLLVRSSHHQGVERLGAGLVATAWATHDGVIEGLEDPERPVLAVQWHPEDAGAEPAQLTGLLAWLEAHVRAQRLSA